MSSILRLSTINVLNITVWPVKFPVIGTAVYTDCFNKRLNVTHGSKSYSTSESPLTSLQKKKPKSKKSKKFAELLTVSTNKATQKKIFLGKLNANHVQAFAEQPGLVLGSLKKQVESSKSSNNEPFQSKSNEKSDVTQARFDEKRIEISSERSTSEINDENDSDRFGMLSKSDDSSNESFKKLYNRQEIDSIKKENNSDMFGTLSKDFITAGEKNIKSKNHEVCFGENAENHVENSTEAESHLESQKFSSETESFVRNYLNENPDVNHFRNLVEKPSTTVSGNLFLRNNAKKSTLFMKLDNNAEKENNWHFSYEPKSFKSDSDITKENKMKPFTSEKKDHFKKTSNKPLSYSALHKLKIEEKRKEREMYPAASGYQYKPQEETLFGNKSETSKDSIASDCPHNFFSNYLSRNHGLNNKVTVDPTLSSRKPKQNVIENMFNLETKNHSLQDLKDSNTLHYSNKINKQYKNKYEISTSKDKSSLTSARKTADTREQQKEDLYNEILLSYMDVCICSNMIEKAYYKFMKERRFRHKHFKIIDIDVYNTLLHGYSRQGNWEKVEEILRALRDDGLVCDAQTYAAVFDCLAQIRNEFNHKFVKYMSNNYIQELKSQGLDIGDIFNKTQLINDQREKILSIIHINYPDYKIPKMEFDKDSDCELLGRLSEITNFYNTQAPEELTEDMLKDVIQEQIANESELVYKIKGVHEPVFNYHEKTEKLFEGWKPILKDSFIKSVKILKYDTETSRQNSNLYVYLNALPVDTVVDCMLYEIRRSISEFIDPPTYIATAILGSKIWQRYAYEKKKKTGELDKLVKLYKNYAEWYLNPDNSEVNGRRFWQRLLENNPEGPHIDVKPNKWPYKICKEIGNFLYQIIIKEVKIDINITRKSKYQSRMVPVFYTQLEETKNKKEEIIKFHPVMQKLFQTCNVQILSFDVDQIPMVSPPKPWCHVNSGGYLLQKTSYIRSVGGVSITPFRYNKIPQKNLYPTFDSLNQLQSVPWKINEEVLDVAIKVFKEGGSEELNVPSLPDMEPVKIKIDKEMAMEEVRYLMKARRKAALEKINNYGLWCEALYKLSLANHFRKRMIWLPQNMDFRGRVYPVPPHITHLGADFYRSLFLFAKGKELGPSGLDWLKIHTINLTGTHKRKSVEERLEYANEVLPEILDSAKRPLDGNKWWAKSDEQWQTLAACIEIKNALESPDPEKYVCRFPIHQDGSCNGLQHYAALGRDVIGAQSVNLAPAKTPQDVYSVVVEIVERKRKEDEAAGLPIAKILDGFVRRKVIKQTIMTTVYGVTNYGAKLQIKGQLQDLKDFPEEHVRTAASYLTQKTFESLNEMFTSAREIQDWFVKCAEVITCHSRDYVRWVTPLNLPVEQPYAKFVTMKGTPNEKVLLLPNSMKQKNAFPPNFIHSLDSSHMMLTSLHCEQAGITFAAIHDCFWTHPSTVEAMNSICREQFIALHSKSILEDLSQYFCETYTNLPDDKRKIFSIIPPRGNFDLSSVRESTYFFS